MKKALFPSLAASFLIASSPLEASAQSTTNTPLPTTPSTTNQTASATVSPATTNTTAAVPSRSVRSSSSSSSRNDYQSFHIISDRNIFNATRSGGRIRSSGRGNTRTVKVDYFKLLGTMSYEKGRFAIFGGSDAQFRKMMQTSDLISGFKIEEIGPSFVKISVTNGEPIELKIGMQMRRQDNGPWRASTQSTSTASTTYTASTASTESTASNDESTESSGPENDVIKRLMQKREQELNK